MPRPVIMVSLWVVLGSARLALAQDAPPLEPPAADSSQPPVSPPKPVSEPSASARPGNRPLLVIPGVTAPARRGVSAPTPKPAQSSAIAKPADRPPSRAPVVSVPESSSRPRIPLTLEPIEDEPTVEPKVPNSSASRGRPVDWPPGVPLADERPAGPSRSNAPSATPDPPRSGTSRGLGLFGRLFGATTPDPPKNQSRNPQPKTRVNADPRPDLTTDAAAKKKIEREIQDALGDRLRSAEVRVSGRNVLIVAKASRFWQKRNVKRALETLPGLAGYRARVDVID